MTSNGSLMAFEGFLIGTCYPTYRVGTPIENREQQPTHEHSKGAPPRGACIWRVRRTEPTLVREPLSQASLSNRQSRTQERSMNSNSTRILH